MKPAIRDRNSPHASLRVARRRTRGPGEHGAFGPARRPGTPVLNGFRTERIRHRTYPWGQKKAQPPIREGWAFWRPQGDLNP